MLQVDLERGLELLAQKKQRNKPLRTLGAHPETNDPVEVFEGRYGPYVKHKRTNATIPKGTDPQAITLEEAVELIAAKASKKGGKRKGGRKKKSA